MLESFITGLLLCGGLIISIGAQNTFIIRQGIKKEYVFTISTVCFLCDVLLMAIGVWGVGKFISDNQILLCGLTLAGILFLAWYGISSLRSASRGDSQFVEGNGETIAKKSVGTVIFSTLAFSLLNPHVLLDTVVIIGGVSSTIADEFKIFFLLGALTTSLVWFYSLGYFALWVSKYTTKRTWQIIDLVIGVYMLFMAWKLFEFLLQRI